MTSGDDSNAPEDVRRHVRELWLTLLPDCISGTFSEAGGDSLSGMRLLGAIHKTLGLRVAFDQLYSAKDLDDFAERVARQC